MRIDPEKCTACEECIPYCVTEAIHKNGSRCMIDFDRCVECYSCLRSNVCLEEAFITESLTWPRILRHVFSSVHPVQQGTGMIEGRGTAEMKTNDVTNRYKPGDVGFTVDVGRPGVGATFADVEMIASAVARAGVTFVPDNPVTKLMTDVKSGKLRDDIKNERILSCILEFTITEGKFLPVIEALDRAGNEVNTVFSVGCISRCREDGMVPIQAALDSSGVFYRPNGKINIGLGKKD